MKVVIGTRASQLALWQANHVKDLLEQHHNCEVELKKITTKGDVIQDRSLWEIGGKGLFLKEIEEELLAGTIDLAVHSMKDVPFDLPGGLCLQAILKREDSRDALLSRGNLNLSDLPERAVLGTSSLRRKYQILQQRPDLQIKDLRGNVDTRIQKLKDGAFDAIVLAAAGLNRLGWQQEITEPLNLVSAVGQGAIGIETREGDKRITDLLACLHHEESARCVHAERVFSKALQASCQTPIGCLVQSHNDQARVCLFVATPEGKILSEKNEVMAWDQVQSYLEEQAHSLEM